MDFASIANQLTKLIEAFEKTAATSGADLISEGPKGEPNPALVQEFESYLLGPESEKKEFAHVSHLQERADKELYSQFAVQDTEAIHIQSPKQNEACDNIKQIVEDLNITVDSFTNGTISPAQLLRIQFLAGMFRSQVSSGNKLSQSAAQDIEMLLKQQS